MYLPGNAALFVPFAIAAVAIGIEPASLAALGLLAKLAASLLVAASVALVHLALRGLVERRVAIYLTLAYALGTSAFAIASRVYMEHAASLALNATALVLVLRASPRADRAAGFVSALAAVVRPSNAFLGAALLLFLFVRRRRAFLPFVLWGLGPLAFLLAFDAIVLGSPFRIARGLPVAGSPLEGGLGNLLSPSRGLLVYSPFLPVGLAALAAAWRRGAGERAALLRCVSLAAVGTLVLYGGYRNWWGGWSYGNRYLADLLPVYVLAIGEAWRLGWFASLWARLAFAAAMGWSILLQAAGAGLYYFYWRGAHWDATPDIDATPWRLWSWTEAQWQFVLARLVNEPPPTLVVEAAILAIVVALFVIASRAADPRPSSALAR